MDILSERVGDIMIVTLNRPEARNGITPEMFAGIMEAFKAAEAGDAKVIVTKAAGKTFCVGADAGGLEAAMDITIEKQFWDDFEGRQGLPGLGGRAARLLDPLGFNRWAWEIAQVRVPSIAVINGAVAGAGLGLSLLHHFRFASRTAKFTTAFGRLGLGPELGSSYLLPDIVGRQNALDLFATSRVIDATRAVEIGLADRLCAPEELLDAAMAYAEEICATPVVAARAGVDAIMRQRDAGLRAAMEQEWSRQKDLWGSDAFKAAVNDLIRRMKKD